LILPHLLTCYSILANFKKKTKPQNKNREGEESQIRRIVRGLLNTGVFALVAVLFEEELIQLKTTLG